MKSNIKTIENNLKINFNNKKLLIQSLIHKSYNEKYNNEECKKIIEKEHQNSKLRCITDELSNSFNDNNKIELSPLQHQHLISALKNYNS